MDSKAKKFGRRYPWADWFGRGQVRLRQGREYSCRTDTMAQQARFTAKRLGVKVHIEIADDGLSLTLTTER